MLKFALLHFAQQFGLDTIVALALADLFLGVASALKRAEFQLNQLPKIAQKAVPYGLAYIGVVFLNQPTLTAAVFAGIVAGMSADVLKNVGELFPGVAAALPNGIVPSPPKTKAELMKFVASEPGCPLCAGGPCNGNCTLAQLQDAADADKAVV